MGSGYRNTPHNMETEARPSAWNDGQEQGSPIEKGG